MRHVYLTLLCFGLACGGVACAPKRLGPTASGYYFTLRVLNPHIFLPDASEVRVDVQNAQGQPVDGVSVTFQVEPGWAQNASILPQQALTQRGSAQAVFRAQTIGSVRIIVRVDNAVQADTIIITPRPSPPTGASLQSPSQPRLWLQVSAGRGGEGTLTLLNRKQYRFTVSGLDVVAVGFKQASAVGKVYNLRRLKDFEGTYSAAQAGITVGGGVGATTMQNEKGVVINLTGVGQGIDFRLAVAGMTVKLKK